MSLDITLTIPPTEAKEVFDVNITHNLSEMAEACGLYDCMWGSEPRKAWECIAPLRKGIEELKSDFVKYSKYNSDNGWGNYHDLLRVAKEFLTACETYPQADVSVSK